MNSINKDIKEIIILFNFQNQYGQNTKIHRYDKWRKVLRFKEVKKLLIILNLLIFLFS